MRRRLAMTCGALLLGAAGLVLAGGAAEPPAAAAPATGLRVLEPGLSLGVFASPVPPTSGDGRIHVLRIDPSRFELRLLSASAPGEGATRSAKDWSRRHGLVAATNASMFQTDHRTSVGLMRTAGHVNNPALGRDKAVLAFDPLDAGMPQVQILDRECQDYPALAARYRSLVQSIRMLGCTGENVWKAQPRSWSTAAIGTDRAGRVLFLHARSPFVTHEFIRAVSALPLELTRLMYVEGGPEAQLFVEAGGTELELLGSYETGFFESDSNAVAWPVPNVVGVARRAAAPAVPGVPPPAGGG